MSFWCLQIDNIVDGRWLSFSRQKIPFGTNIKVGCIIRKTRKELSETCRYIRKQSLDILVGDGNRKMRKRRDQDQEKDHFDNFGLDFLTRQRVATFGNSKTSEPQDWIEITLTNPPDLNALENLKGGRVQGECGDVITSLHIEIYHTSVGSQGKTVFCALVFGYRNCSDLLREKIVLVTEKNF